METMSKQRVNMTKLIATSPIDHSLNLQTEKRIHMPIDWTDTMAPVRKYLKIGHNTVIVVHVYLDQNLLRSLAQKVQNSNTDEDTNSILELASFSLPTKEMNQFIDTLSPHLVRVFSAQSNNSYSAAEFYNLKSSTIVGKKKMREEAGIMNYKMNEKGWHATVMIQRPEYDRGYAQYTSEQVLERKVDIQEELDTSSQANGDGDDKDEKPLVLKKNLTTKYERLYVPEDSRVVVYIQERPSSKTAN